MKVQRAMFFQAAVMLTGMAVGPLSGAEPPAPSAIRPNDSSDPVADIHLNELPRDTSATDIWQGGTGLGFRKGVSEAGLSVGYSVGSSTFGSTDEHDLALTKIYFGRIFTEVGGRDRWYAGNWEILGEFFGGVQINPDSAYVIGLTPVLRYNFATGTRWVPFFDAGAGVALTDIGRPDLGGVFQFNLQTGPGVHWFVGKDTVLTFQYRFLHISNASLQDPNHGVNTSVFYVGVGTFF